MSTNPVRDALDDLVTEVPRHVIPPNLAALARGAGRRRTIRRRVARAGVAALVVAAVAFLALPLATDFRSNAPAGRDSDARVTSYPQRIGHQWFIHDLPQKPGPMAGLIEVAGDWQAVASSGERWRLPVRDADDFDESPTISPSGRYIGYVSSPKGPYILHDLVAGVRHEFAEIGSNWSLADWPYMLDGQTPSFWSPNEDRVVVPAFEMGGGGVLVLGVDGAMKEIPYAVPTDGWTADNSLAYVSSSSNDSSGLVEAISVTVRRLDGTKISETRLNPSTPWQSDGIDRRTASVSPDGSAIAVLEEARFGDSTLHQFDLATGRSTAKPISVGHANSPCALGWAGDVPTVLVFDPDVGLSGSVTHRVGDATTKPIVAVEPELGWEWGVTCMIWAEDALAGGPTDGFLDLNDAGWTWWWREIALGLLFLGLITWIVVHVVRRRGRRSAHVKLKRSVDVGPDF